MSWLMTLLLSLMIPASADQSPDRPDTPFAPMAFLVGHCWIGTFPDGKRTDEHCFEWVFDRRFIRDRHVVRGGPAPYAGESLFRWDTDRQHVAFWYWNSLGGSSEGHAEYSPDGIVFPERHTNKGKTVEMRSVWTQTSATTYRVRQLQRDGDDWRTLWTMELHRKE